MELNASAINVVAETVACGSQASVTERWKSYSPPSPAVATTQRKHPWPIVFSLLVPLVPGISEVCMLTTCHGSPFRGFYSRKSIRSPPPALLLPLGVAEASCTTLPLKWLPSAEAGVQYELAPCTDCHTYVSPSSMKPSL